MKQGKDINEISGIIVDRAVKVHQKLGPDLLESVYQRILAYELRKAGLDVEPEVPIPVEWDGNVLMKVFGLISSSAGKCLSNSNL